MKVELEIKPGDFTGWVKRLIKALHSWGALLIASGGFLSAAILFADWLFAWKLVGWAVVLAIAAGIRGSCQDAEAQLQRLEEERKNRRGQ